MKTKRLLICLTFLIGILMANVQAQNVKPKPDDRASGMENTRKASGEKKKQFSGLKKNNRNLPTAITKATTFNDNEGKTAYGFRIYDEMEWPCYGIVQFNTTDPTQMDYKFEKSYSITSGAWAKGNYYICKTDDDGTAPAFINLNLQSGEETILADISGLPTAKSMTYDNSSETMYLLQWKKISKINLTNGEISDPIPLDFDLIAIACTYDGRLYGIITETSELVEINPLNGKLRIIGKTGIPIENMYQSLAFDHGTNTLYWAGYGSEGFLATINVQTGTATRIGTLGNNSEIAGLYIPYNLCPASAPGEVAALKATPDKNGGLNTTLTWTNPSKTYDGKTLTELAGIKIYRDGVLVKTITPASIGKTETYTDQVPASGKRQYKIVPYNSIGDGAYKYSNIYIGQDYPAEITNLEVNKNEQKAVLSWTPPATGANKGWFDPASVKYKITRFPDQTVLETAYTGNSTYTAPSVEGLDVYSYQIEAFNESGSSDPVISELIAVGNHIIPPYACDFSTQTHFDLWSVIDNNNDLNSWKYDSWGKYAQYLPNENDADDWLVTSPVQLEGGKYYKLILDLEKVTWMETHENLRVAIGTTSSAANLTTILADYPDFTTGAKSINLKVENTGEYYIGLQCYTQKGNLGFQLKNVEILPSGMTDLAAVSVSLGDSIAPINSPKTYMVEVANKGVGMITGYTVELTDASGNSLCSQKVEESLASDAKARITLEYTSDKPGNMIIYARVKVADDANPSNDTTSKGQKVEFIKTYAVSGKVTDEENNPINGAFIKLSGFRPFIVETAQDGTFVIPEVYPSKNYNLQTIKNGFDTQNIKVNVVDNQVSITTIQMKFSLVKPIHITVDGSSGSNLVSWTSGVDMQQFRYDNGAVGGAYGPLFWGPTTLVGSVYEQPTRLTEMSWVTDDNSGKHETVNLFVLALDINGKPTSEVLFSQLNVPNTDTAWGEDEMYWNKFTFPYPIEAPHGFFVAVGCDQPFTLFVDDISKREEYPFMPFTHYVSDDFTSGVFSTIEEMFFPVNLFIRAGGAPTGTNEAARFVKGYKVWRLLSGNEKDPSGWKELTSGIQTNTAFQDGTWNNAAQGVYRYAIRTEFSNGQSSGYAFSDEVQKDMIRPFSAQVKTNTPSNEIEGAKVVLKNSDNKYETILDNTGQINFTEVWKGTYELTVRKAGFDLLEVKGLEIGNESAYGPYTLKESVLTPYNLSLSGQTSDQSRTLNWNLFRSISDDFESHEDFEINSEGKAGWLHLDGDNSYTYGVGDGTVTFPNQNKKMAYIIFTPSMTTPSMSGSGYGPIQPNNGDKFLAFISSSSQIKANNDFLISPELNFEDDFKFRFYARTCDVGLVAAEQMRVGYSLTGTQPEDFTWLTGEGTIDVPNDWTRYSYNVPAKAKYVTINYVSYDMFMLMVDDVFIGYDGKTIRSTDPVSPSPTVRSRKCEIYLDGKKVAETEKSSYTFDNLTQNNKTVGIRSLFASGSSEIVTVQLDGSSIDSNITNSLQVYFNSPEKTIYIDGNYIHANLFDTSGKLLLKEPNTGKIDVKSIPAGIYILRIYAEDGTQTLKISIDR